MFQPLTKYLMIMDTKNLLLLTLISILFLACNPIDPESEKTFVLNNNTNKQMNISLYQSTRLTNLELSSNNKIILLKFGGIGGDFGAISDFDSISILLNNGKLFKRTKPNNSYGYIDTDNNIGTDRNIGKDFYNKKYWQFKTVGSDEEWTFTINEEDLNLFE